MNCFILYTHYIITENRRINIIRKQFNYIISNSISYVVNVRNNKGPSTEFCGTLQETQVTDD